ncbi:MAG: sigma-70 family RNA polymerase sigma factor [Bacteroidetes bacterium]|nr:MAG: sigma-70 family RNA polymerase sigma factor [Bacteroidota bacterium]
MAEQASHIRNLSDTELVALYKNTGESICVGELFSRYRHLVYGVCMKYLGDEDESQDVQMQVFEKLPADLVRHEISQFKGWLYAVARNECLMYLRRNKSMLEKQKELQKDAQALMENEVSEHPGGITAKEHQLQKMEEGIKQLNENQRICVDLFYLQEKCYKEIADITGYSLNEVKSHIQNGKRNLKIYMSKPNE